MTLEKIQKWNVSKLSNYKWLFNVKLIISFTQNHKILMFYKLYSRPKCFKTIQ
jgi:hypothetical protein